MNSQSTVVLGFDPGGRVSFGWCTAVVQPDQPITVVAAGVTSNAVEAAEAALDAAATFGTVAAAGIDAPLFWSRTDNRTADRTVRQSIASLGAPHASGTVQTVNSLRGACLVQGILVANLLRQACAEIRLTEAHPKALLWLLGLVRPGMAVKDVSESHMAKIARVATSIRNEHARDAILGAFAAAQMLRNERSWRDLVLDEKDACFPVENVEYWMPSSLKE